MNRIVKLAGAVFCALCAVILIGAAAVAAVALITSSSFPEVDDMMSDPAVISRQADDFTGWYAYNIGTAEFKDLSPDNEVLRCWGWNEETAERYAYEGVELETITEGPDGGTYCKYVSADELLS